MNLVIREAELKDLTELKELQQSLVNFERPFDDGIPAEGDVNYYDINGLLNDDFTYFVVAEMEGKIIGCGFAQIRDNLNWAIEKKLGYIGLMVVREEYRRNNTGKLIIENLTGWLNKKNISHIILETYSCNKTAINAYKKYGFKEFVLQMKFDTN
ncbi:MAG: GNAT family N-acetyltransferase [Ignavibacteria bacterium]